MTCFFNLDFDLIVTLFHGLELVILDPFDKAKLYSPADIVNITLNKKKTTIILLLQFFGSFEFAPLRHHFLPMIIRFKLND